jgi:pectinesterase
MAAVAIKEKMSRYIYINGLRFLLLALTILLVSSLMAQNGPATKMIVVDINGKGDFQSIQAAINSLPDSSPIPRIIHLKKGIYREKIFIEKHNIVLEGEDRDGTVVTQDIARDEWRCSHKDDWGVATFNLNGNDVTL